MRNSILAACIASCVFSCAIAGEFKIKQYEIGMSLEHYYEKTNCRPSGTGDVHCIDSNPSLTIGGEQMKKIFITFEKGDIASYISIEFDPDGYRAIKKAVIGKYKKVNCSSGFVSNGMGMRFTTEECVAFGVNDVLFMKKYDGKISEGSITLISKAALAKESIELKKQARDI